MCLQHCRLHCLTTAAVMIAAIMSTCLSQDITSYHNGMQDPKETVERTRPVEVNKLSRDYLEVMDVTEVMTETDDPEVLRNHKLGHLLNNSSIKTRQPPTSAPDQDSKDQEEIAEVVMKYKPSGALEVEFSSHGKRHRLEMTDNTKQPSLTNIPIKLLGMSEENQAAFQDELKKVSLLHDKSRGAKVAVKFEEGQKDPTLMNGAFNLGHHHFEMRKLNTSSNRAVVRKRSVDNIDGRLSELIVAEVDSMSMEQIRVKREVPEKKNRTLDMLEPLSATVELGLILDYRVWTRQNSLYNETRESSARALELALYYAHAVSMMDDVYGNMQNPDLNVSVLLSGIVMLTTPEAESHLTEDRKRYDILLGESTVYGGEIVRAMKDWLRTPESLEVVPAFDHVMLVTGYPTLSSESAPYPVGGVAWVGGICDRGLGSSMLSTNIFPISLMASSIMAHELGHNLGAAHDNQYGCGSDNFIMESGLNIYKSLYDNRFSFSCCSQRAFYATISSTGSCLFEETFESFNSTVEDNVTALLPGQIYDADDQCYIAQGIPSCGDWIYDWKNDSICRQLWCDDGSGCINVLSAAADGTTCGDGLWCLHNECVPEGTVEHTQDYRCDVLECHGDEFKCTNGVNTIANEMLSCVLPSSVCDDVIDCSDASDEMRCGDEDIECSNGFSACENHENHYLVLPDGVPHYCVHDEWVCDGIVDCPDASDETNCTVYNETTTTQIVPFTECGGTFSASSGRLSSPNFPDQYPNNTQCTWYITVPNINIQVEVLLYNVVCPDKIKIQDTATGVSFSYCGKSLIRRIILSSGSAKLEFTSDATGTGIGVLVNWSEYVITTPTPTSLPPTPEPCLRPLIGNRGTLTSPNYPAYYENDFDCTWTINVRSGSIVVIKVLDISVEHYSDWLAIIDDETDTVVEVFTGEYTKPMIVNVPSRRARIQFYSNNEVTNRGWKLFWYAASHPVTDRPPAIVKPSPTPQPSSPLPELCYGYHNTSTSGILRSPNYPNRYYTSLSCKYDIIVDNGIVILEIGNFSLESERDFLRVYDLQSNALLRTLTGYIPSNSLIINGISKSVRLVFTTNHYVARPGWTLTYHKGCACYAKGHWYFPDLSGGCHSFVLEEQCGTQHNHFCPAGTKFDFTRCSCQSTSSAVCPQQCL